MKANLLLILIILVHFQIFSLDIFIYIDQFNLKKQENLLKLKLVRNWKQNQINHVQSSQTRPINQEHLKHISSIKKESHKNQLHMINLTSLIDKIKDKSIHKTNKVGVPQSNKERLLPPGQINLLDLFANHQINLNKNQIKSNNHSHLNVPKAQKHDPKSFAVSTSRKEFTNPPSIILVNSFYILI